MSVTLQQFGIDRLSREDRLALAEALWESVAAEVERTPLSQAEQAELDRRLADSDANPDAAIPWETVKQEALKRAGL